ncbi:hypothetical protein GRZ55_11940 [Chelativorans sp. ZYF759]|uniref:DUF3971 domain-containing protein n=1 Tax=Chelativorans sp. ZYF759 TaxID=2692213 RepID=UPI00145E2CF7|nr:hypothetical protein [Chelativorans sp. ZYF759]
MREGSAAHEKVRFRRNDISDLDRLPSAVSASPVHSPRVGRRRRRRTRFFLYPVAALLVLAAVAVAGLSFFGGETLRQQAERTLSALMDRPVSVHIGATGLTLDENALLAIRLDEARVTDEDRQLAFLEAGAISFAIRPWPLLAGRLELGNATISDARIDLTDDAAPGFLSDLMDERGLIDTDRLGEALFARLHDLIDTLEGPATDRLRLRNVEMVLVQGEPSLTVEQASLRRTGAHEVEIEAALVFDGREIRLSGKANRPGDGQPIGEFTVKAEMDAVPEPDRSGLFRDLGALVIGINGREGEAGSGRVNLTLRAADVLFAAGRREEARFGVSLAGFVEPGLDKFEISRLNVTNGLSAWRFNGAVGPVPAEADATPGYRFELISDGSRIAPEGSLEPPLDILASLTGRLSADGKQIAIDQFAVRIPDGEVKGSALITLASEGRSPGIEMDLVVADFPVGSAKQLWPWLAAHGAREWAHRNLFGGRIVHGRVDVSLAPGRLNDGVPLVAGEVTGAFNVERVRFDVARRMPAIRDGVGSVVFDGSLIDVALESGTVYLASGRTVQATGGTLRIDAAPGTPLVGALDIDVSGEAAAILELASHDPINAGDHIDFEPADFEGSVSGKIVADIPLGEGVRVDDLEWMVVLEYRDLDLARPIHGFRVSEAAGSILVEPGRVVIDAETLLDGVPATVYLVEPLGGGGGESVQEVALRLDDTARDRFVPGLAAFLSGAASVKMQGGGERREIGIDLSNSRLTVPWAGWAKGAGIPAKASFVMDTSNASMVLDNFALEGETFAVRGRLALRDGELEGARFPNVRLNRGDEFSLDIGRAGGGYKVDITGRSLDARALIKHLTQDEEPGGEAVEGVPVTVEMRIDRIDGFHDESLRDVRLSYSGTGSLVDNLVFSAITSGGAPVYFRHDTVGGTRNVTMQSNDAGAVVRFLDIYEKLEGGSIELAMSGPTDGPLSGTVDARDFWIVNEPRLGSIVSTAPAGGDRSLNQALRSQIDVSRVRFDRGFAELGKGPGYLSVERGVLRSPNIGTTFRGILYDANGRMDMSGTFMPAYGLNRLFGEIPLVGQILGNGRDGGLIGVTYRLAGEAGEPQLQINPLSVVAPGIFRSVFEFN